MDLIITYIKTVWEISSLMALYIFFGLIAAGIIHELVSENWIKNKLGGRGIWPSVRAAVYGIPLPVCSCGVIPLAASLRKSGAGKGAVTSFFIATPMTGADSIIATYGVFGWVVTLSRIITAFITAVFAGALIDYTDKNDDDMPHTDGGTCCCSSSCCSSLNVEKSFSGRLKSMSDYAFGELLAEMAFPLLLGILLAGGITMLISPEMLTGMKGGWVIQYAAAFAVGIPLYVCSVSAIPVALSLMLAGFSGGAAFIFLSAAPATNAVTISIVKNFLGRRAVAVYLVSIVFFTLAGAVVIDLFFGGAMAGFASEAAEKEGGTIFHHAAAVILLVYLLAMSVRQKMK